MYGVIADSVGSSAWSYGGAILTFVFPMLLFVVVASALYVAYTKPELVPGRRNAAARPVIYTAVPGPPSADGGERAKSADGEKANLEGGE